MEEVQSLSPIRVRRGIYSINDLESFKKSDAYAEITTFVRLCGESVSGLRISDVTHVPEIVSLIEGFMNEASDWINEFPPIQQPMRFGNKAFRSWQERLQSRIGDFVTTLVPPEHHNSIPDLSAYLSDSFGNERRIDYGTGHETNLAIFFLCLFKIHVITERDLPALILKAFPAYIKTMRALQSIYLLEPAGSHGVWGLDDYHCLIYVWGSFQLSDHPEMTPKSVRDTHTVSYYAHEYLYLEGIATIYRVKSTAPFSETSPMLYSVSELRDWRAVKSGMLKLYEGEVLNKLPVVQHIVFGSLFQCTWTPSSTLSLPSPPVSVPMTSIPTSIPLSIPRSALPSGHGIPHHDGHIVDEFATAAPWARR